MSSTFDSAADWTDATVAGVPVRLWEPEPAPAGGAIWLADFDGANPEALPGWREGLAQRPVRMLCPQAGPTWWLDRPDPGFVGADQATAWQWLREELIPFAANRFGGPLAFAGAGPGGQAAIRAGFRQPTPAVWAYAPAVQLETVHGCGSTLDGLFENEEQARVASVLTDVNALARPKRFFLGCDPTEFWAPGCELLVEKLRSGGVPVQTDFDPRAPADRESALNAAGRNAAKFLADALTFAV
ncbi:MAG: hypothetical protein AAF907_10185 [Planctomycetota bacterium]